MVHDVGVFVAVLLMRHHVYRPELYRIVGEVVQRLEEDFAQHEHNYAHGRKERRIDERFR